MSKTAGKYTNIKKNIYFIKINIAVSGQGRIANGVNARPGIFNFHFYLNIFRFNNYKVLKIFLLNLKKQNSN